MAVERKLIKEHKRRVLVREFLHRETERAGFGGAEIQRNPMGTRINLIAERPGFVIGRRGATIKKLTTDLQERFALDNPQIEVTEDTNPSLNPQIMAQKLAEALERGWHFRRAGHSTLRRIMDSGARGCLIRIAGKLTGGRSRSEKFLEGHIKFCGETALVFMNRGYAVAKKKLGTIGVTVAIMNANARLPDEVTIAGGVATGGAPVATAPVAAPALAPAPAPAVSQTEGEDMPPAPVEGPHRKKYHGKSLTDVAGIGKAKAAALIEAGFTDIDALLEASVQELAEVAGIGPKLAQKIKDELTKGA
ncbi:MAG TPA: 30S ribosomal protein S3 [Candidatus Thermoplasmatota archaeon]|nr:30S ribosomal protein S3 [Candidatus Thermoplasmatota archaeon]